MTSQLESRDIFKTLILSYLEPCRKFCKWHSFLLPIWKHFRQSCIPDINSLLREKKSLVLVNLRLFVGNHFMHNDDFSRDGLVSFEKLGDFIYRL